MKFLYPTHWQNCVVEDVFDRIVHSVEVEPNSFYREIGIRSHGKGLFEKPPIRGSQLGEKRVFWVEPNCLVLNIVFAWEQAVARTTSEQKGMIASHRFPMFRPVPGRVNLDFVLYFFKSKWGKRLLELGSPGGAGRNKTLNQKDFDELPLCLPPLEEQARIVAVLRAWDRDLELSERFIAARRKRKSALYQKLFANLRKRPFLESVNVSFSGIDKKSRANEDRVLLCNYTDVFHNSRITSKIDFMRATATQTQIREYSLQENDVVFTKDSETAEEIAEPALVAENIAGLVCGYHLAIARPIDGVGYGPFIAQAMRHESIRSQFSRVSNGVVRHGLTLDAIEQVEIFLPAIEHQRRIAAILDAEDLGTEALSDRLKAVNDQKLGLMQKLLTGQWDVTEKKNLTTTRVDPAFWSN